MRKTLRWLRKAAGWVLVTVSGITLLADDLTTVLSRFGASAAEFYVDGQRVASFGADGLEIPRGRTARFGELAMVPRSTDGHVSIKWVG